jgi:hypothetical protein
MLKRSFLIAAVLGLVLGLGAPITRADVVDPTLDVLIATGGSITVGDKVFSQFNYTPNAGTPPTAASITVEPIPPGGTDSLGNFGIRFAGGASSPAAGGTTDFVIGYTVTNLGPGPLITDVHLTSNLSLTSNVAGVFGTIVEQVKASGIVAPVAQINNSVTATTSSLSAIAGFIPPGPYQTLVISKDVQLVGTSTVFANVSIIDQSFSQVPEPGSLMLLGLGGLGLMGYTWRRR